MVTYFCDPEYADFGRDKARLNSRIAARWATNLRNTGRALAAQQDVHTYGHDTVSWPAHALRTHTYVGRGGFYGLSVKTAEHYMHASGSLGL